MMNTMKLVVKHTNKYAKVEVLEDQPHTCIITATSSYIPIEDFKTTFGFIATLAANESVRKLIFDKRNLRVFHQPSMEWYFTEWKEEMFDMGLKTHRKILPEDEIFRTSVKIGRQKIAASFPDGKFHQMDIQYAESLEEAIEN